MDDRPSESAPAAHHTLRILGLLSTQRGPVAASTIAHALELPRSTVYRLLGVLAAHGFVLHFPEVRLGRPILSALVDRLGESAHLAVLHGRDVVYLIEERAPRRPHLVTDVGVRLPSHVTASGRALLATLPKSQLRALFPSSESFVHHSDTGPSSYSELSRLLEGVRERGFAAEDGDVTEGIASVAVAVRDHAGWPAAGIAVSFPRDAIPVERWPELADQIGTVAAELSRRISGQASPR
jgi:DNA-binding IclR family transcriptional regulator